MYSTKHWIILYSLTSVLLIISCSQKQASSINKVNIDKGQVNLLDSSFIYSEAPFPECHASSIVDLEDGRLMATWFGGTEEKHPDVTIWISIYENGSWSPPRQIADGIQNQNLRYPCWNPVLFKHTSGRLFLFFKVGPNTRDWWGEMKHSDDNGQTWSDAMKLPDGQLGPIRAKPIELEDGNILCPSSEEFSTGEWIVHMELFDPFKNIWSRISVDPNSEFNAIQPTLFRYSESRLQMMCRSRENRIVESWSHDNGMTWSTLSATTLPNPSAGIDGITLADGRQLLVYNPTEDGKNDRAKLYLAISENGKEWQNIFALEDQETGEFSYPAMIQLANGDIHISYTWKRKKLKHAIINLL